MHFFQSAVAGNDTQYIKGLQFKNPILRKKNENKAGEKCLEKNIDSMRWDEMGQIFVMNENGRWRMMLVICRGEDLKVYGNNGGLWLHF